MGQKIHPEGFRVGYIHDWKSNWFAEKDFSDLLMQDLAIRDHIETKLAHAGLSDITIQRRGEVAVDIHTARPGIVIGKSGSEVDALRKDLHKITGSPVKVNIREVKRPELDAKLVAQSIAEQLQNRVAFRRAMKRALTSAMRSGAKGVRGLLGRPRPAPHDARRHRLRLRRGQDRHRPNRRQVLDQQGRDHARRLRVGQADRARAAAAGASPWRRGPPGQPWGRSSLMLMPKRVKHRKVMRGRRKGNSKGGTAVTFGEYGLKSLERGWITNRQIEAARVAMTRKIKRGGKVWINVFPDKPITKKPAETRMGSGKGNPEAWVAVVKPGRVMFELSGVDEELAREAMRVAGHKLPVKTKFVMREGAGE